MTHDGQETTDAPPQEVVTMLGRDHLSANRYGVRSVGLAHRTACALSLGGLGAIPRKGGTPIPNEDCLVAADFGAIAFHAVADGHRGYRASHGLAELMASRVVGPGAIESLIQTCDWLHGHGPIGEWNQHRGPRTEDVSRTTATFCAIDRERGIAEGWSIGDSAVFHWDHLGEIRRLNEPNTVYVTPSQEDPIDPATIAPFRVEVRPGDVLLSCSDGVFECHYESPRTSVSLGDLSSLLAGHRGDAQGSVVAVSEAALAGVRGNPGGQDNIAVIATVV